MDKKQIKQEFISDFEQGIDFNDAGLTDTEKKKFHEIYEKWDGKIILSDSQVLQIMKDNNLIQNWWALSPNAIQNAVNSMRKNTVFLQLPEVIALTDREKVYRMVGLRYLEANCGFVTTCADVWKQAYDWFQGTHREKTNAAIRAIKQILKDNDANGDEVAMMQLYLKRHFGDTVAWSNAAETAWIDGLIGEDFLRTALMYTGEAIYECDEEKIAWKESMDVHHNWVAQQLQRDGSLETSEETAFKEYKQGVLQCLNMYSEYYKNLIENIIGMDWFDKKNITEFKKHIWAIENWLSILQYDWSISSKEKVNTIIFSIVWTDPVYRYSRVQRTLYERQKKVKWLDYWISSSEWEQVIRVTDLYETLIRTMKDNSLPPNDRKDKVSLLIRDIDRNDYNTNSIRKKISTLWLHSYESWDAVGNTVLDEVHEEIAIHWNEKARDLVCKTKDFLEDPQKMQWLLQLTEWVTNGSDEKARNAIKKYLQQNIWIYLQDSYTRRNAINIWDNLINKILWYTINTNKSEEKKKMKKKILEEKKKTIMTLENLQQQNKLSLEGKKQLEVLRGMVLNDSALDKYMQTTAMSSIGLIIENYTNHHAFTYDSNIVSKSSSVWLQTYADIHGAWWDLSDETLATIHQTSRSILIWIVTSWVWMAAAWVVSRAISYAIQTWLNVQKLWTLSMIALEVWSTLAMWATYNVVEQWIMSGWDRDKFWAQMDAKNFVSRTLMMAVLKHWNPQIQKLMEYAVWKKWWIRVTAWRVIIEEAIMWWIDYSVDRYLGDGLYTKEEFIQWMMMGLAFEAWGYKFERTNTWVNLTDTSWRTTKWLTQEQLAKILESPQVRRAIEANSWKYFDWKESIFWFSKEQAEANSKLRWEPTLNDEWNITWFENTDIVLEHFVSLAVDRWILDSASDLDITEEMKKLLVQAHASEGNLWELTNWQLLKRIRLIDKAFAGHHKAKELRLLGLEGWFFGMQKAEVSSQQLDISTVKLNSAEYINWLIESLDNKVTRFEQFKESEDSYMEEGLYQWLQLPELYQILKSIPEDHVRSSDIAAHISDIEDVYNIDAILEGFEKSNWDADVIWYLNSKSRIIITQNWTVEMNQKLEQVSSGDKPDELPAWENPSQLQQPPQQQPEPPATKPSEQESPRPPKPKTPDTPISWKKAPIEAMPVATQEKIGRNIDQQRILEDSFVWLWLDPKNEQVSIIIQSLVQWPYANLFPDSIKPLDSWTPQDITSPIRSEGDVAEILIWIWFNPESIYNLPTTRLMNALKNTGVSRLANISFEWVKVTKSIYLAKIDSLLSQLQTRLKGEDLSSERRQEYEAMKASLEAKKEKVKGHPDSDAKRYPDITHSLDILEMNAWLDKSTHGDKVRQIAKQDYGLDLTDNELKRIWDAHRYGNWLLREDAKSMAIKRKIITWELVVTKYDKNWKPVEFKDGENLIPEDKQGEMGALISDLSNRGLLWFKEFIGKIVWPKKFKLDVFWQTNVSREVFEMINENPSLRPKFNMSVSWKQFYLTESHESFRDTIIWYTKDSQWVIQARLFYYSISWGNRHCSPWFDEWKDWRYSKGEYIRNFSYEKWTVVVEDLQHALNQINVRKVRWVKVHEIYSKKYWKIDRASYNWWEINTSPSQQLSNEVQVCSDLLQGWKNTFNSVFGKSDSVASIKHKMSLINISNFNFNSSSIRNSWTSTHAIMWEVTSYSMTCHFNSTNPKFNWRPVEIVVQHSVNEPWLLWVENIVFSDSHISSFWNASDQISWWVLTAKPREYESRLPESIKTDFNIKKSEDWYYKDIRWVIQSNPLLTVFRNKYSEWSSKQPWYESVKRMRIPSNKIVLLQDDSVLQLWEENIKISIDSNSRQLELRYGNKVKYISSEDNWVSIWRSMWRSSENYFWFPSTVNRNHWSICLHNWKIWYRDNNSKNWSLWVIVK